LFVSSFFEPEGADLGAIVLLVVMVFASLGFALWRARRPWTTGVPVKRTARGRVAFVVGWTAVIFGVIRLFVFAACPSDVLPLILAIGFIGGGMLVLRFGR